MKWIMEKWKEGMFVFTLFAILFGYCMVQFVKAEDAFEQIAKIAKSLEDPKSDLIDYLVNMGVKQKTAKGYAIYNIGSLDSTGNPLDKGTLFLERKSLYELGILKKILEPEKFKVIDTLWDFRK